MQFIGVGPCAPIFFESDRPWARRTPSTEISRTYRTKYTHTHTRAHAHARVRAETCLQQQRWTSSKAYVDQSYISQYGKRPRKQQQQQQQQSNKLTHCSLFFLLFFLFLLAPSACRRLASPPNLPSILIAHSAVYLLVPRHARAMPAPCPRHARAMPAPCPRHACAMPRHARHTSPSAPSPAMTAATLASPWALACRLVDGISARRMAA